MFKYLGYFCLFFFCIFKVFAAIEERIHPPEWESIRLKAFRFSSKTKFEFSGRTLSFKTYEDTNSEIIYGFFVLSELYTLKDLENYSNELKSYFSKFLSKKYVRNTAGPRLE